MVTYIANQYPVFHVNIRSRVWTLKFIWKNKHDFTQALADNDLSEIYSVHGTQSSFDLFHKSGTWMKLTQNYVDPMGSILLVKKTIVDEWWFSTQASLDSVASK